MYVQARATQNTSAADIARLLVQANLNYRASNDPAGTQAQRTTAREDARQLLNQVTRADPKNAAALNLLGRLALDCNELDKAQALFTASLEADPNNNQAHANLGYWALMVNEPAAAEQHFSAALQQDPQSAAAFCGIAHARREMGQYDVAWLHYRRLIELGKTWPSVYAGMIRCAEWIRMDNANPELAMDVLRLLGQADLPHQKLGHLVTALLHAQYDLSNPEATVVLDEAAQDSLLILGLQKTLLTNPAVEELVTLVRTSILQDVANTGELREALQPLAIAIGHYTERTGYALLTNEGEVAVVEEIHDAVQNRIIQGCTTADLAGAAIVAAMYGSLFQQTYAVHLGAFSQNDWPLAMQDLMAVTYYNRASDEAYKQNFDEKEEELLLSAENVAHAWPNWTNLDHYNTRPLREEIQHSLQVPVENLPETLRVLVVGTASGQRALEMARHFSDVEVIAVDEDLANLAHGSRNAERMGLENIVFWPWSLASRFLADGNQVQYIELVRMPSEKVSVSVDAIIRSALASGGILHVNTGSILPSAADEQIKDLIQRHRLAPSAENLQRLRRMVMNNRKDSDWEDTLNSDDFYASAGCRRRWFYPEDRSQIQSVLDTLANEFNWKLVKARDTDGHNLASAPVLEQLRAQQMGSTVQSLVGQGISLYFRRR